jgi:hypothetical protein
VSFYAQNSTIQGGNMPMSRTVSNYNIEPQNQHFIVLQHGQFMSSADTLTEAENDIENYEQNQEQEVKIA